MNADKLSSGSGSGASLGPALPPCPKKPWHCQQPFLTKASLPFSADAASAAPPPITPPAASAASDNFNTQRISNSPRLAFCFEHELFPTLLRPPKRASRRREIGTQPRVKLGGRLFRDHALTRLRPDVEQSRLDHL